jgi:hypothetical protein
MHEINDGIFKTDINDNIYIIPDIHGDYQCIIHILVDLIKCCNMTKIYDDTEFNEMGREYLEWNNSNSIVVFCGDMIHRKRFDNDNILDDETSDIYILQTIIRLKKEAMLKGGNIIIISGNHEIMNIVYPEFTNYISPKNIKYNFKYFTDVNFVNEYIKNSYAWIKINDILISHGSLCNDYINSIVDNVSETISKINTKYHNYFNNFNYKNINENDDNFDLFIKYDMNKKSTKHNMFWCREFGYPGINCDLLHQNLKKINCSKLIINHCPQFLNKVPLMINFECKYTIARLDIGMSRSFDYNKHDLFITNINNNHNRKISILKLHNNNNVISFNEKSIISCKLSCIQYLLLKYGITKNDWINKNINTNWIGFEYLNNCHKTNNNEHKNICSLLYPFLKNHNLLSIQQFNSTI